MAKPNQGLDLTTVGSVMNWLRTQANQVQQYSDDEQQNIQDCITAASIYWLWKTGRGPMDNSIPAESPFVAQVQYNETYDGNGNVVLMPRNYPIASIQSLTIGTLAIPASSAYGIAGYIISSDGKRVILRGGSARTNAGVLSVGFQTVLGSTGYRFGSRWDSSFNAGLINIQYTAGYVATPIDIDMAVRQLVAENYRSRGWIGQRSQMMPNVGTVTYTNWEIHPKVAAVLEYYTRTSRAA